MTNPKPETRNPEKGRNSKPEIRIAYPVRASDFGLPIYFRFWILNFGF